MSPDPKSHTALGIGTFTNSVFAGRSRISAPLEKSAVTPIDSLPYSVACSLPTSGSTAATTEVDALSNSTLSKPVETKWRMARSFRLHGMEPTLDIISKGRD